MGEKFEHKKSLGQHFLNSDYVPRKMCEAADLKPGEVVFEIGPGTGALTKEILAQGGKVIALETDPRAIEALEETFQAEIAASQLTLHHGDARTLEPASLGLKNQQYKTISNIPYYLSGLLFRTMLETNCQPNTLVFLVQKEVAVRIARDKKESLLSLSVKAFGDPTYICTVPKGHFTPPPKIDSAIVAVRDISRDRLLGIEPEDFFYLLHLGFGQKRKQLIGNLSTPFPRTKIEAVLAELSLPPKVRAEDITLQDWVLLCQMLLSQAQSPT